MKLKKNNHLLFFDDTCFLCWRSIQRVQSWDRKKTFLFIPLRDRSSKAILGEKWKYLKSANTLILLENYHSKSEKIWIRGKAVARILWLLGGWKKILGILSFLPFGPDALYSIVAKRRRR